ncbi:MAG: PA14 domain-containing protein [Chloroflexota bacterium]
MKKLAYLVLALGLALFAHNFITTQFNTNNAVLSPHILRDGGIILALALVIALCNASPLAVAHSLQDSQPNLRLWRFLGQLVFAGGVVCTTLSAGLYTTIVFTMADDLSSPLWNGSSWLAGVVIMLMGLLMVRGTSKQPSAPAYRWGVDAAGKPVRLAIDESSDSHIRSAVTPRMAQRINRSTIVVFIGILIIGAGLRLWQLESLPANCIDVECILGLQLASDADGNATNMAEQSSSVSLLRPLPSTPPSLDTLMSPSTTAPTFHTLSQLIHALTDNTLRSLRLTSAIFGILTLLFFFLAARRITYGPGAAIATLLLALNPWHIWVSRSAETWSAVLLWLVIGLWAWLEARTHAANETGETIGGIRWWGIAGLAFGFVAMEMTPLFRVTQLWLLVATVVGIIALRNAKVMQRLAPLLVIIAGLAVAAPVYGLRWGDWSLPTTFNQPVTWEQVQSVIDALFWGSGQGLYDSPLFADNALLHPTIFALFIIGLGCLLRSIYRPNALLTFGGFALFGYMILQADPLQIGPTKLLLLLLPWVFLTVAIAADQLVFSTQVLWQQSLRPRQVMVAASVLLLLVTGRATVNAVQQLDALRSTAQGPIEAVISQYLAECVNGGCPNMEQENVTLFVPDAILNHPSTRLLTGSALDEASVLPLSVATEMLMGAAPGVLAGTDGAGGSDLMLLVPNQTQYQERFFLLQQLYPYGRSEPIYATAEDVSDDANNPVQEGQLLFTSYQIPAVELQNSQGLAGSLITGSGANRLTQSMPHQGSLEILWASSPVPPPFNALWTGTLVIPIAGNYTFLLDVDGEPTGQSAFTMLLDNALMIDTSLGLRQNSQTLARGLYKLDLSYRHPTAEGTVPQRISIRWQRPDGVVEVVPPNMLNKTSLPNMGLVGTYYENEDFQAPATDFRKDLLIDANAAPNPDDAYSIRWVGKLAAPLAGEYLLASVTDASAQILVNGQMVVNNQYDPSQVGDVETLPGYQSGTTYLNRGWQNIEIRYASTSASIADLRPAQLELLWQPPAAGVSELSSMYLAPLQASVYPSDVPIPPGPAFLDARLVNGDFALTQADAASKAPAPSKVLPPSGLPPMALDPIWQMRNGCGVDATQLNYPHGLAIKLDSNDVNASIIYVADTGNRRVAAYDWSGTPIATYTTDVFQEPVDVAVSPSSPLPFVLDAVAQQIFRIDLPQGDVTPIPLATNFYRPRGFDVDERGIFYVADTGGARVVALDSNGVELFNFGGQGSTLGKGQPVDALFSGNGDALWAITSENGRLWRLDTIPGNPGSMTAIQPTSSIEGPKFAGLADGSFFVTDPGRQSVLYHSVTGQPLQQFAYQGVFTQPVGIAAAQQGGATFVAVTDSDGCSLSLWRMQ